MAKKKKKKKDSRKKAGKKVRKSRPDPQPSSLNQALFLWLSNKPAALQNTILIGFAICALLFFSVKVVDAWNKLMEFVPKNVPDTQGVIRNESDLDIEFLKIGDFTIQASSPYEGKFDLSLAQAVAAADSNLITVPAREQVSVQAKFRNTRKVYEHYKVGGYALTLTLSAGTQRYIAQIDRFSESGLKKGWTALIPSDIPSGQVIKVCFDELSNSSARSILQDKTESSIVEDLVPLKDEIDWFREDLERAVEDGRFFKMITKERFGEFVDREAAHPKSVVVAKIAIGIYKQNNNEKIIWEVTDARDKMKKLAHVYSRTYSSENREDLIRKIITDATLAIISEYPIEGRISDASRKDDIVEMGIGRLAGVREHMTFGVYCGRISGDTRIGNVKITATWSGGCEGKLDLNGTYKERDALTSLLVCSRLEEFE